MRYKNYYIPYSTREKQEYKQKYHDYLGTEEWADKRAAVLERDNYMCQNPKCPFPYRDIGDLHVHHKTYDRVFNESLDDLITVCVDCHRWLHNK